MKEITRDYAFSLLPVRPAESNKATFGSVLNIAGSANFRGAACLSSLAALRVGAGYATLACPEAVANGVASFDPDVIVVPLKSRRDCIAPGEWRTIEEIASRYSVVSIGPGLSSLRFALKPALAFFLKTLDVLRDLDAPVVFDADALNMLAASGVRDLPCRSILTPHPKELARLLGVDLASVQDDRQRRAAEAAERFRATVVLKGHRTVIAGEGGEWVNGTGGPALAKAGTGDVLTGMISGLCAQGLSTDDAACLGVYLHGLAGDIASRELTDYGVLASDLLRFIPCAIAELRGSGGAA
jgi:hydroxyethylthiazole kinase-like uncharacterized protein yjeF